MENADSLEQLELRVPRDSGTLIGNTLRQFAMRGSPTWQPAAYKIGPKEGSFGLGGDHAFSYLEFYPGRMLYVDDNPAVFEKVCKFERRGEDYVHGEYVIKNLGKLQVPSMEVCLVFARGSRTSNQNRAVAERLIPQDTKSFVAVPSRHTPTVKFSFKVSPVDLNSELLQIEATKGSVAVARQSAVLALQGLHI